jgi:hypothetical protein
MPLRAKQIVIRLRYFLSLDRCKTTQLLHAFHADDDECMCRVVESVGEHVEEFVPGDTVVPTFLGQCDACPSCASEHNNMCTAVPFILGPGMRHYPVQRRPGGTGPRPHGRVQLQRVHRRGHEPSGQARPRRAAHARLRRRHR